MILTVAPGLTDATRPWASSASACKDGHLVQPTGMPEGPPAVPAAFKSHSSMSCKPDVRVKPRSLFAEDFRHHREGAGSWHVTRPCTARLELGGGRGRQIALGPSRTAGQGRGIPCLFSPGGPVEWFEIGIGR